MPDEPAPAPQPEPAEVVIEDDGDFTITFSKRLPDHD